MSDKRNYSIKCPRCEHPQEVELYESINVKISPSLKEQLMMNQINRVTCPNCELAFRVDKPLLYSDPDAKLLIYWIPTPADAFETGEEQFSEWLREMGSILPKGVQTPEVHLVFTRTELVERIFMFEAQLNERVIEYIKYTIFMRNAGKLNPAEKTLLFNAQDSTKEALCFVIQDIKTGRFEAVLHYNRDAYQAMCETFDQEDKTPDLLEMFPGPHISARTQLLKELKENEEDDDSEIGSR